MRHSGADASFGEQARQELAVSLTMGLERLSTAPLTDKVWVSVDRAAPPWYPQLQPVPEALRHRANRYGQQGEATRRMRVTFAWNNLALAELRDLNRHRTGNRSTPLIQAGFYLPPEIRHRDHGALLADQMKLTRELMARRVAVLRLFASPWGADAIRARHPRRQVHLRGRAADGNGRPLPLCRTPERGPCAPSSSRSPRPANGSSRARRSPNDAQKAAFATIKSCCNLFAKSRIARGCE